jgi:hypothetical protein
MGQTKDPEDGAAVAFSIFLAVAVYGVRRLQKFVAVYCPVELTLVRFPGIPCLLRPASLSACPGQPAGSDIAAMRAPAISEVEASRVVQDIPAIARKRCQSRDGYTVVFSAFVRLGTLEVPFCTKLHESCGSLCPASKHRNV